MQIKSGLTMKNIFRNKQILVTGGVGSIGSEIVKNLLPFKPASIRIYDNNEYKLFAAMSEKKQVELRPLLGDIRDYERISKAMKNVDIVFHAAALKHVELSEYNPFEVVKTNIFGTQNLLSAALENEVERVVIISTDKAVNPASTMGATKLVAERLAVAATYHKGNSRTKFSAVRFGNVLGSNGSVIPTWLQQIKDGNPIQITDQRMTRFMMTINDAVQLVFKAASHTSCGETFILKMPSLRIIDLAQAVYEYFNPSRDPKDFKFTEIGKKTAEKLHEELIAEHELDSLHETDGMYVILPPTKLIGLSYPVPKKMYKKVKLLKSYSSQNQKYLSKSQIRQLLKRAMVN